MLTIIESIIKYNYSVVYNQLKRRLSWRSTKIHWIPSLSQEIPFIIQIVKIFFISVSYPYVRFNTFNFPLLVFYYYRVINNQSLIWSYKTITCPIYSYRGSWSNLNRSNSSSWDLVRGAIMHDPVILFILYWISF